MRWQRMATALAMVVILTAALPGQQPAAAPPVQEIWEACYLEKAQIGEAHTTFTAKEVGGRKAVEGTTQLKLEINRFGNTLALEFQQKDVESQDGKVLGFAIRQILGKGQPLTRTGKIKGQEVEITVTNGNDPPAASTQPWDDKVLGLHGEYQLFQKLKLEAGHKFEYRKFEPELNVVVTYRGEVTGPETVAIQGGIKTQLTRVKVRMDPFMGVQLPGQSLWLDAAGEVLRREAELPGLGTLVMLKATRAQAQARGGPVQDVGVSQLVRVNQAINRFNDTREVAFRIHLPALEKPEAAFATDDRQAVRNVQKDGFELVVRGQIVPESARTAAAPPAEFLRSNQVFNCADALVQKHARAAVGAETDPWRKAVRIERWVHDNIKNKNFDNVFETADVVARTLEGDCTEHAVLAAAMCRAAGVPARGALGLVHVSHERAMGFHMWFEVWVNGKWYALDGTLGQGKVGATHVKVLDHSWNDVPINQPMLGILNVLQGKLEMTILSVQ